MKSNQKRSQKWLLFFYTAYDRIHAEKAAIRTQAPGLEY
jgi:hypothetical protein